MNLRELAGVVARNDYGMQDLGVRSNEIRISEILTSSLSRARPEAFFSAIGSSREATLQNNRRQGSTINFP